MDDVGRARESELKASTIADVTSEAERRHVRESMLRYIETKPEQVRLFERLAASALVGRGPVEVLDAACGVGDLTYYLRELAPEAQFTCVDLAPFVLEEAARIFAGEPRVRLERVDLGDLVARFGLDSFDVAFCKQTLSWLPGYEVAVEQLLGVTRGSVFVSSLFYDGRIDFDVRISEHSAEEGAGRTWYQNVYSLPRFSEFCLASGAREVTPVDFEIGIDLPRPADPDRMGTYTVRLEDGRRLQISGGMLMPWKVVRIDI